MHRKKFVKLITSATIMTTLSSFNKFTSGLKEQDNLAPVLFIGHGSPTNALENNEFTSEWKKTGNSFPKPKAILIISAHWLTKGTHITAMENPKTIHDFGGFSKELHEVQYPAPGSPDLAKATAELIKTTHVGLDHDWGLDHGAWSIVKQMYPEADIPIVQLSIDYHKPAKYHYELSKELFGLRKKGVMMLSSGNMVHNLRMIKIPNGDFGQINTAFGFDWAMEINEILKNKILEGNHQALVDYERLHKDIKLAIPTPDHYYPLLYSLGLQDKKDNAVIFNDKVIAGSLNMTSVKFAG